MPDVIVHHLEKSRSHRILWLLEELGVEYEMVRYERHPKTLRAPPELAQIHPLGKSPVVAIGHDVLAESGAIVEEIVDRFGKGRLRPEPGTEAFRRYRFWLHYAEGSFMPPLLVKFICHNVRNARVPFFVKPVARRIADGVDENYTTPELQRHFAFVEKALGESRWFVGDELTAADVQMIYPMEAAATRASVTDRPRMAAWLEAVRARPAFQRALERGGPSTGISDGLARPSPAR